MKSNFRISGLVFLIVLGLSSCNEPLKLARHFSDNPDLPAILFISDPLVLIEFYPPDECNDSLNRYKPNKIFSMVEDSLTDAMASMFDTLFQEQSVEKGFQLYNTDSIADFFMLQKVKWQLSLVQLTFEEHRIMFSDVVNFADFDVTFDTVISSFEMNAWFELSPVNADSLLPVHLLFASANVADGIDGRFTFNKITGNYDYSYTFYPVITDDIVQLVFDASVVFSEYLFDFYMNAHVYFRLREPEKYKFYFHFDHEKSTVYPAGGNRFIFL